MPSGIRTNSVSSLRSGVRLVQSAAKDNSRIEGHTHLFYRYPARFSPLFVRAAIEAFTRPGDIVLDPFMGGGTSIVEAMCLGRRTIGSDVNSLAVFIARVKTTPLTRRELSALQIWADSIVPLIRCNQSLRSLGESADDRRTHNLSIPQARHLKKLIALLLQSLSELPSPKASDFARCAILYVGQWALNGRRRIPTAAEFRERVSQTIVEMFSGMKEFRSAFNRAGKLPALLCQENAADLSNVTQIKQMGRAKLVVCSPPYPGVHMLYHRWQVDGRKESPAPYWISDCNDGEGSIYYNFSSRHREDMYFSQLGKSLRSIRGVVKKNAFFVQLVSFSRPRRQLIKYLSSMDDAGFREVRRDVDMGFTHHRRTWRSVPSRRWHANMKGTLESSREVLLIHRAV